MKILIRRQIYFNFSVVKQFETLFSAIISIRLLQSAIVMASAALELNNVKLNNFLVWLNENFYFLGFSSNALPILIIGSTTELRLLIICEYGSEIEQNSGDFLRDIYGIDWTGSDKDHKKILIIMQENLKRPVSIRSFNYLKINNEIFLTIMNTSYSLIAVFQQIK